jgi:hypothetical protein
MMPANCASCAREVPADARACPHCGAAIAPPAPAAPVAPVTPLTPAAVPPSASVFKPPAPAAARPAPSAPMPALEDELPARRSFSTQDGLLILGGAVVLVIVWYMSPMLLGRRGEAPPAQQAAPAATTAPAGAPGGTPAAPGLSAGDREAAAAMVKPLRALQDFTGTSPKYADYEPQVLDTRRLLEPYFLARGGDEDVRRNLGLALDLHLLALSTWMLGSRKEWAAILADPRIGLCATVRQVRDGALAGGGGPRDQIETMAAVAVVNSIPQMWACAGSHVGAVEQLLRER